MWCKMIADIFGCPTVTLKTSEGAALGAAIHAGWTYCQVRGKPVGLDRLVRDFVKVDRKSRAEPNRESAAIYRELRAKQMDLTRKLAGAGYL